MFKRRTCIPVLKGAPVTCFCITALFGAYCLAFESEVKLIQPPLVSDLVALTYFTELNVGGRWVKRSVDFYL